VNPHGSIRSTTYHDRQEAGLLLAERLYDLRARPDALILAVPRSGVLVAASIAWKLRLPLALFPCRKLVHPANPHQTIGSVCHDEVVLHPEREIPTDMVSHQVHRLRRELRSEQETFGIPDQVLENKTVILVDDRLKQADTLSACIRSLKKKSLARIVVAVPIATLSQVRKLERDGVDVIALQELPVLAETASYFDDFHPPTDSEIRQIWKQLGIKIPT